MRLATNYDRIHGAGAEVVAISVDDEGRQAGLSARWGLSHTRLVSDPGGERYLQPLGLFDPEARGGIALPGILVLDPDGTEVYRYQGRDFADRTTDEEVYGTIESLGLPAIDPGPWVPTASPPDDLARFFRPVDLGAYFRGNRFASMAIEGRVVDPAAKAIAKEHRKMADATLAAWDGWKATID